MAISSLFGRFFQAPHDGEAVRTVYGTIVRQARSPAFYEILGVPDTPDGRFDMIVLHAYLVFRRLRGTDAETKAFAQALFDLMFADMDNNLREMGIGDTGVATRVKGMAKGFYGRSAAYDRGLDGDGEELRDAIHRNVFRNADAQDGALDCLADYMCRESRSLQAQAVSSIRGGEVRFGPAPATIHQSERSGS